MLKWVNKAINDHLMLFVRMYFLCYYIKTVKTVGYRTYNADEPPVFYGSHFNLVMLKKKEISFTGVIVLAYCSNSLSQNMIHCNYEVKDKDKMAEI